MFVICAGMYRSCSTWQYAVSAQILEQDGRAKRLGYLTGERFVTWQSENAGGGEDHLWVVKSHEGHHRFEKLIAQGKALALYSYRDARDVIYSLGHKLSMDFPTLLRLGRIDQILVNDRFWTSQPGVLVQRYEHILADPLNSIHQIAAHLGVDLPEAEARQIMHDNSLEANRERTQALGRQLRDSGLDLSDPAHAQFFDPHTLLHWNHVREGRIGSWRNDATPEELAILASLLGAWLIKKQYETDLSWAAAHQTRSLRKDWEWKRLRALGALACGMRRASLRYPELAAVARRCLGLPDPEEIGARPASSGPEPVNQPALPPHSSGRPRRSTTTTSGISS